MQPEHWTSVETCVDCVYCKLKQHHCSCCSHWDVYECGLHEFEMDASEAEHNVCIDIKNQGLGAKAQVVEVPEGTPAEQENTRCSA